MKTTSLVLQVKGQFKPKIYENYFFLEDKVIWKFGLAIWHSGYMHNKIQFSLMPNSNQSK